MSDATILPDGSAFSTLSMPLPSSHWLYKSEGSKPPMPLRMAAGADRERMVKYIWQAARYAIRGATMHGADTDFDPDALCQNMVVGLIGYFSEDGLGMDDWDNPNPIPPLFMLSEAA